MAIPDPNDKRPRDGHQGSSFNVPRSGALAGLIFIVVLVFAVWFASRG